MASVRWTQFPQTAVSSQRIPSEFAWSSHPARLTRCPWFSRAPTTTREIQFQIP